MQCIGFPVYVIMTCGFVHSAYNHLIICLSQYESCSPWYFNLLPQSVLKIYKITSSFQSVMIDKNFK